MPRPVYIICSESGSQDRLTGLVSHFNVIEKIEVQEVKRDDPSQPVVLTTMPLRVTAVWLREPADSPEHEYPHELVLILPNGDEKPLQRGTLRFTKEYYRIARGVRGFGGFMASGILCAESRLTLPDGRIIKQSFPIVVEAVTPSKDAPQKSA